MIFQKNKPKKNGRLTVDVEGWFLKKKPICASLVRSGQTVKVTTNTHTDIHTVQNVNAEESLRAAHRSPLPLIQSKRLGGLVLL